MTPPDIDKLTTRDELHKLVDDLSQGGKWYCGVRGSRKLAREWRVGQSDVSRLIAYCWNRITLLHCTEQHGRNVYGMSCDQVYDSLPARLRWPRVRMVDKAKLQAEMKRQGFRGAS